MAAALVAAASGTAVAQAGVKEGVDAWQAGDYSRAITEWRKPADAGDADAQFNLAQAYKLGRGVPNDLSVAQQYYYKAAVQGHEQAQANLGLILFQNGDRRGALPWIQKAADRGEPRAQYVLGTALFNGDIIPRDWPRAYALMTRAAASGLPQATTSLAQMDQHMARKDRDRGLALSREMAKTAASPAPAKVAQATPTRAPSVKPAATAAKLSPAKTEVAAKPETKSTPAKASAAKAQPAGRTEPKQAATAKAEPEKTAAAVAKPAPKKVAAIDSKPGPKKAVAVPKPAAAGKWRIQLGAYSSPDAARSAWNGMRTGGLASLQPYIVKAGAVHRLQAGPFASRVAAEKACTAARRACFPTGG